MTDDENGDVQPPNSLEEIGRIGYSSAGEEGRQARKRLATLWGPTRAGLEEQGWESITPGAICQLYVSDGESEALDWVLISPQTDHLRLSLNFVDEEALQRAQNAARAFSLPEYPRLTFEREKAKRTGGVEEFLAARIGWEDLLGAISGADALAARLAGFVLPIVAWAAQPQQATA